MVRVMTFETSRLRTVSRTLVCNIIQLSLMMRSVRNVVGVTQSCTPVTTSSLASVNELVRKKSKVARVRMCVIDINLEPMPEAAGVMRDTLFPAGKCLEPHLPV